MRENFEGEKLSRRPKSKVKV